MLIFIITSLLNFAFAQQSSPVLDPDKFTVCSITVNSDDERKIFESQVAKHPKKFNPVVELTNLGNDSDWFKNACKSGVRCDQLIISGHFAGHFFGEHNEKTLSLKEIEEAGCSKTCEGILNQPLEVFLFGCNTLSGKNEDHRTPAQYLQVLLQDGIPLGQAEQIVESRYGNIGDSNKSSMQRAFGGENKKLYGFHSVGPSGKNIKGFLQNYFKKISAPDHLEKLQAKRMMNQVSSANTALKESLKVTAFSECDANNMQDDKTKAICKLRDTRVSVDEKLDTVVSLMTQKDYLVYFPYMNDFFNDNKPENFNETQKETLKQLTENTVLRDQVRALAQKTSGLGLKKDVTEFAFTLGYIDESEREELFRGEIKKFFAKSLSDSELNSICSIDYPLDSYVKIKDSDLPNKNIKKNDIYAYECLNIKDPVVLQRVLSAKVDTKDENLNGVILDLLIDSDLKKVTLPTHLIDSLNKKLKKESYERDNALSVFTRFIGATKESISASIQALTEDSDDLSGKLEAADHLMTTKVKDPTALLAIAKANNKDLRLCTECLKYVLEAQSNDPSVMQEISKKLSQPNSSKMEQQTILDSYRLKIPLDPNVQAALLEYAVHGELKLDAQYLLKDNKDSLTPENKSRFEKQFEK